MREREGERRNYRTLLVELQVITHHKLGSRFGLLSSLGSAIINKLTFWPGLEIGISSSISPVLFRPVVAEQTFD